MPVSEETKDCLDQVKKGKPRKFVMLVKGPAIVSLIAYKKGAASKFIKEAKQEGSGLPYFGVITGKGMDVSFQLAVADGFDKPPVKDLILKKFLEDEADFKCMPSVEIVQACTSTLDPDDPLHAKFIALREQATAAAAKNPPNTAELKDLCKQIETHLEVDERNAAEPKIKLLGELLKASSGEKPQDDGSAAFTKRLRAIKPELDIAVGSGSLAAADIKLKASEAAMAARKANFTLAGELLDQVEQMIRQAQSGGGTAKLSGDFAKRWPAAKKAWLDASGAVDDQIAALQSALKTAGDGDLEDIAQMGLNAVTGGFKVPLLAAIRQVDAANDVKRPSAAAAARKVVVDFRKHLETDERVAVCDENPFDVSVSIRDTLGGALEKLEDVLSA